MTKINMKRIYDAPAASDGYRILADRLWPRGLTKEEADYDAWEKEITPSNELRHWFHESPDTRWEEFKLRYKMELKQNPDFIPFIEKINHYPVVTLLTAAKDISHCHVPILKQMIEKAN